MTTKQGSVEADSSKNQGKKRKAEIESKVTVEDIIGHYPGEHNRLHAIRNGAYMAVDSWQMPSGEARQFFMPYH